MKNSLQDFLFEHFMPPPPSLALFFLVSNDVLLATHLLVSAFLFARISIIGCTTYTAHIIQIGLKPPIARISLIGFKSIFTRIHLFDCNIWIAVTLKM